MRAASMPWAPPLLAAVLAAALLPRASGQTFSGGNVITVPTVAYISFAVVGLLLLIIMLLLKYRASTWRRREEERQTQQLRAEREAAEKEAWEAANALREVHIPPIVLNPDCSFGLAEPDKQLAAPLPDAVNDASGPEQQAQQAQAAQQPSWWRPQGRPQQATQQQAQQGTQQQAQRSQRMQEGRPSGSVELLQLPPAAQQAPQQADGAAWPGATVYVRGSRAAFASASLQPPLV